MTKQLILPLAALMLLSACAGKFGLQKRRYTKGYYFSVSRHSAAPKGKTEHQPAHAAKQEAVETVLVQQQQHHVYTANPETLPAAVKPVTAASHAKASPEKAPVLTASAKKQLVNDIRQFKSLAAAVKKQQKNGGGDAGANTVVLVILSLFPILALIAIYIHDGHKITTNFWIDLILHLTIIGYIIYALLVVLDVVDLS